MPSAAEPTHPGEPAGPPGRVLSFDRHARRHRPAAAPVRLHADPAPDQTPEQLLAETMEALFLRRGHTLSDDSTADIYRTTLQALQMMLDGSLATGKVGEEEHRHLSGMVAGMRGSPDEL
ncbi:hypothetical protein [Streptomyces sp. NPDC088115]|uniref:hypothetical protein n=1 Tax=Streptomyces sp. NPDC088115 TaxID=3365824 RepID=UPI003830D935